MRRVIAGVALAIGALLAVPALAPATPSYLAPDQNGNRIHVLAWVDENGNRIRDRDEPGMEGVKFVLKNSEGKHISQGNTNELGVLKFKGIHAGKYTVTERLTKAQSRKYLVATRNPQNARVRKRSDAVLFFRHLPLTAPSS